ncbi:hypothetical protein [Microseira wollei]|uniref:hypothetical protein n=1 Tax=Microseira wollei TaxID=467598 RepID=UPI001CFC9BE1|nr:hypothetical protein [Microseira wollei]
MTASEQGQVKIKQARETRGWTVRYEDTTGKKPHRLFNNHRPLKIKIEEKYGYNSDSGIYLLACLKIALQVPVSNSA